MNKDMKHLDPLTITMALISTFVLYLILHQDTNNNSKSIFQIIKPVAELAFIFAAIFAVISFVVFICKIAASKLSDSLEKLKANTATKETLELLLFDATFPNDEGKVIHKYIKKGKANYAIAKCKVNGKLKEIYWAVSDDNQDAFSEKESFAKYNSNDIPVIFCNNRNNKLPFLIRSADGELIELNQEEIDVLKKIPSFPSPNTTCTERKILGHFLKTYCNEIENENNTDKYELYIYTKNPPCKYCNEIIEYLRKESADKYHNNIKIFVLDDLFSSLLLFRHEDLKIKEIGLENIKEAFQLFEQEKKDANALYQKDDIEKSRLLKAIRENKNNSERYKQLLVNLIGYQIKNNGIPDEKQKNILKKICCVSDGIGLTEKEFDDLINDY